QLDRFLFKIEMKHIDRASELEVLDQYPRPSLEVARDFPSVSRDEILAARRQTRGAVHVAPVVKEALVDLARLLRSDSRVLQGASTRALVLMLPALQARAVIHGRDFVAPEDIEALAPHVFKHRLECAPGVEDVDALISEATAVQIEKLARASLRRG
ncbi:MAG: AAA family ATPase, partial [Deltaproteobacteria bacterium]|nr:AAA family ATPase [Deltaproteobacteria bacterium]